MPRPTEKLTKQSSMTAIRSAISATIEHEVNKGMPVKQAAGMAYDEAREKTGKRLKP